MATPARKLYNAQSDIWDAHEPIDGEFTLLPVGVPPLITTAQEILLAGVPEGYATAGQNWNPKPISAPRGTLVTGSDFFPFYQNGVFWYTRPFQSMLMNGLLIDYNNLNHRACFEFPSPSTFGFYRLALINATPSNTFIAITNLVAGQTLDLTEITLFTTVT